MVQSYIGSYGAIIHPVAACATAAVSVEEGIDKIWLGKAELGVAGGFDDPASRRVRRGIRRDPYAATAGGISLLRWCCWMRSAYPDGGLRRQ